MNLGVFMDIKYNLLVILLFTTTIHSQDLDEFDLDLDLDSGDEMLMMDVAVDPLIFDERGIDNEEFRTFFIEQLFDYSSDSNALLTSQIEFMESFPLITSKAFIKALGVREQADMFGINGRNIKDD